MIGLLPAVLLIFAACYLIGGTPLGYLAGRVKGIDIRSTGSGNIGATNVSRVLGRRWGVGVFALDVAKGLVPMLIAGVILDFGASEWELVAADQNLIWLGSGVCCILGHNYPVYLRFRGGKGASTSFGVVLGVYPYLTIAGLGAFGVWLMVTLTTRYVSAGSVSAAVALPLFVVCGMLWGGYAVFAESWPLLGFSILASALVVYRHRGNLTRLRAGTESKIGSRA